MTRLACVLGGLCLLPAPAPAQSTQLVRSELKPKEYLLPGDKLCSPDGRCSLVLQGDGNLVWLWRDKVLWHAATCGVKDAECHMQADGNLVIYGVKTPGGQREAVWASDTSNAPGAYLRCQPDGNLVLYHGEKPVWATSTIAATKTAIKLKVTRPDAWSASGSSMKVFVNNELVGKINNNKTETFEVPNARVGKNDLCVFYNVTGLQFFPNAIDKDKNDKWAGTKFFAVTRPGETITLKVGDNDSDFRKNHYEVSNEVAYDWIAPETTKVVFDVKLKREVLKEEPAIRLAAGDTKVYEETVSVREVVSTVESWKVEAEVRATVTDGWNSVSGGIRAEWEKTTTTSTEVKTTDRKTYTMVGNGHLKKVIYSALYRTGVATVWVGGKEVQVPFKLFERFDVHSEDVAG